jgi:Kef-type K+ transport system membrane component KefB
VSAAVGAFLVGIAISGPAAASARPLLSPLRDLFAAVFFVFFGLQTDPAQLPGVVLPALALAAVTAAHRAPAVPLAIGGLLVLIGVTASVWLVVRVAAPPDLVPAHGPRPTGYRPTLERATGLWIGLAACVGCTLSALVSIRDDRFPRAVIEAAHVDVATLPAPPREGAGEAGS